MTSLSYFQPLATHVTLTLSQGGGNDEENKVESKMTTDGGTRRRMSRRPMWHELHACIIKGEV